MTSAMLGYLMDNLLIDSDQYEKWCGLSQEELQAELGAAGIMNRAEFESFSRQLAAIQTKQGE